MKLPPPRRRPKFALWRYEQNIDLRKTADLLEQAAGYRICSHEKVRTLCLPYGHPDRTEPDADLMAAIAALTGGEVTAGDWCAAEAVA